jgi:hypothetical protein
MESGGTTTCRSAQGKATRNVLEPFPRGGRRFAASIHRQTEVSNIREAVRVHGRTRTLPRPPVLLLRQHRRESPRSQPPHHPSRPSQARGRRENRAVRHQAVWTRQDDHQVRAQGTTDRPARVLATDARVPSVVCVGAHQMQAAADTPRVMRGMRRTRSLASPSRHLPEVGRIRATRGPHLALPRAPSGSSSPAASGVRS